MYHSYEISLIFIDFFEKYLLEVTVCSMIITYFILILIVPNSEPKWWPDQPLRPPFTPYLSKNFVVLVGTLDVGILCIIIGRGFQNIANEYGLLVGIMLFFGIGVSYFWISLSFVPRIFGNHKPSPIFWVQEWVVYLGMFYMCLFFKFLFFMLIFMLWNFLGMFFWPEWTIITS